VSRTLVARALAEVAGIDPAVMAHRLMGQSRTDADAYRTLMTSEPTAADARRPYPFFLASALECEPRDLGPITDWIAEWKWDGMRAQLVRRGGDATLWSRGEELANESFPEIVEAAAVIPDELVDDAAIVGDIDHVRKQIALWEAAGVTMMVIGARSPEQINELAALL
jgi:DNA ligase-1